jgi:purine nucleosidase
MGVLRARACQSRDSSKRRQSAKKRVARRRLCPVLVLGFLCIWRAGGICLAKIPVVMSTDVGAEIGDQWAIAYLLTSPQYHVLGTISAHAPDLPDPSAEYTYHILKDEVENHLWMDSHPPLFEGANRALTSGKTPRVNAGVEFLVQASKRFSRTNRLTVLTIGAATDVASAILEDPTIVDRIRVVAMAFENWQQVGPEFNVANDVNAWQVILDSNVPVVVGCGDVCRANLALTFTGARGLISKHGPIGAWLWHEYQAWYFRFVKPLRKDDFSKPWIIWDTITVAHAAGMTAQQRYPRPRLNNDMTFDHIGTDKTITWITAVDSKRMWADFLNKLDVHERTHRVSTECASPFLQ